MTRPSSLRTADGGGPLSSVSLPPRAMAAVTFMWAAALGGCDGHSGAPATESNDRPSADFVVAHIQVVDLWDNPLAGMTPIVTAQPNAFDEPIATGAPTGPDGRASLRFTANQKVYLRAWDPELNLFPNNYYDILPGGGTADGMVIKMAPAAVCEAQLLMPDGAPAASQNAGIMMMHPTRGPWWPAEANTDANGLVRFEHLPPGLFTVRLKVASGGMVELPDVTLAPGTAVNLGAVQLR